MDTIDHLRARGATRAPTDCCHRISPPPRHEVERVLHILFLGAGCARMPARHLQLQSICNACVVVLFADVAVASKKMKNIYMAFVPSQRTGGPTPNKCPGRCVRHAKTATYMCTLAQLKGLSSPPNAPSAARHAPPSTSTIVASSIKTRSRRVQSRAAATSSSLSSSSSFDHGCSTERRPWWTMGEGASDGASGAAPSTAASACLKSV